MNEPEGPICPHCGSANIIAVYPHAIVTQGVTQWSPGTEPGDWVADCYDTYEVDFNSGTDNPGHRHRRRCRVKAYIECRECCAVVARQSTQHRVFALRKPGQSQDEDLQDTFTVVQNRGRS